jgi:hypothetical protein
MNTPTRPSTVLFQALALLLTLLSLLFAHAAIQKASDRQRLQDVARLTADLGLTDLALFSEAPYTRHPSQADRHAPFQNHPLALDPFPSGSFAAVPEHLLRGNANP